MSYYDDYRKDDLRYEMQRFLEERKVSELLEIVTSVVQTKELEVENEE